MDLYIEKKIHPSIYFNTPHPHPILRVLLRSSPKVILSWLRQFMKILRNTHPLLQLSTKGYGEFKGLTRRTTSDNKLSDKGFNITRNPKHDGYQRGLASVVCNCFDKKLLLRVHNQRPWLGEINSQVEQSKIKLCLIKS